MIQILGTIFDAIHILIYFPIPSTFHPLICISNVIPILLHLKEDQNIIYDKNHELGEVLAKAVKNANKNDYAILILRSIICDAIRQTYRSNLSPKKLVDLQNQLMGHPLD